LREQQEIKHQARALSLIETRERRSLQTTLNREKIQSIDRERRAIELVTTVPTAPIKIGPFTIPQQQKLEAIKETAREITARPAAVEKEKEKQEGKGKLRALFNRMTDLFAGEDGKAGEGPKQKQPRNARSKERIQEPLRPDIDQEALDRYLKVRTRLPDCKMCAVQPRHLARGLKRAPRCIPGFTDRPHPPRQPKTDCHDRMPLAPA
jgi:hypothetical protein